MRELLSLGDVEDMARELGTDPSRLTSVLARGGDRIAIDVAVVLAWVIGRKADPELGPLLDGFPIPAGRPGRPEEIAVLVDYLLSPLAGFFCGSIVFCDGGTDALLRPDDWPASWELPT